MDNFCTLFDKNYLTRGLALIESLLIYSRDFTLYVLCLDDEVFNYFTELKSQNVRLIKLADLEATYSELLDIKFTRSVIEYYFTLSPYLPLYILRKFPNGEFICSLDADIYFFDSPQKIFDVLIQKSVIITPHKYAPVLKSLDIEKYGKYNVSFQVFKNNTIGLNCLEKWRSQCLEWCYDRPDEINQRYADQKYLDTWLDDYPDEVFVLNDPDSGIAVWNIDNYSFTLKNGKILVNNHYPLIFYHFHHFKIICPALALNGFRLYSVKNSSKILIENIYFIYWKAILRQSLKVKIDSVNSLRHDFNHHPLKLLRTHKTGFIKISNCILKLNLTFDNPIIKKIKNINVLFTRL